MLFTMHLKIEKVLSERDSSIIRIRGFTPETGDKGTATSRRNDIGTQQDEKKLHTRKSIYGSVRYECMAQNFIPR